MKENHGFTLIELVVTITIAAVLITIAIPSFVSLIKNNRLVSANNIVVGVINNARQYAISRGKTVLICHTADENATTPTCGGSGSDWNVGILVYVTGDNPSSKRNYAAATDELVVRIKSNSEVDIVASSDATNYLGFNRDGGVFTASDVPVISVCDDRGSDYGRLLKITPAGQLKVTEPTNCATPA